jgi:adhesin transport system membrane fusion protein
VIELDNRRRTLIDKYRSDARAEHAAIAQDRSTLSFRLDERSSVLKHTVITAPMAGVVKYVRITTEGGVLRQGDELMQISPVDEDFLVEIKIDPADVGQVKLGQPVAVQLDAFDRSIYGTLPGELVYVSSDTLVEQGNGQAPTQVYYRAHVALHWSKTLPALLIRPTDLKSGMTATVDIRTGERSVLTYLLKPIQKSFKGALSER